MAIRPALLFALLVLGLGTGACGGEGDAGGEEGAVVATTPQAEGCPKGDSASEVAEAAEKESNKSWATPPVPAVVSGDSVVCADLLGSCPPWLADSKDLVCRFLGAVADYKLDAFSNQPLLISFGEPVEKAEQQFGPQHGCDIELDPTEDPSVFQLNVPARAWRDPAKGCGNTGKMAGGIYVTYGPSGVFAGYEGAFMVNFTLAESPS